MTNDGSGNGRSPTWNGWTYVPTKSISPSIIENVRTRDIGMDEKDSSRSAFTTMYRMMPMPDTSVVVVMSICSSIGGGAMAPVEFCRPAKPYPFALTSVDRSASTCCPP
uniref:Uncharacterized protein n=1 Tax=Anopheles atroparvus TaxID=41427 RepID=A0A182ISU5_ANOAO